MSGNSINLNFLSKLLEECARDLTRGRSVLGEGWVTGGLALSGSQIVGMTLSCSRFLNFASLEQTRREAMPERTFSP